MICIDASVVVSAVLRFENESPRSNAFLEAVQRERTTVFFPEIIIPEVSSGIVRATGDAAFAFLFTVLTPRPKPL